MNSIHLKQEQNCTQNILKNNHKALNSQILKLVVSVLVTALLLKYLMKASQSIPAACSTSPLAVCVVSTM